MNSASDVARRLLHEAHVVVVPGEGFGTQDHILREICRTAAVRAEEPGARLMEAHARNFVAGAKACGILTAP